jgi:hypothetical protein
MDCFAEPVIGRAFARMARNDGLGSLKIESETCPCRQPPEKAGENKIIDSFVERV